MKYPYWDVVGMLLGEGTHILTAEIKDRILEMCDEDTVHILENGAYMVKCWKEDKYWVTSTTYPDPSE